MSIITLEVNSRIVITEDWLSGGKGIGEGVVTRITDTEFTWQRIDTHEEFKYSFKDFEFYYAYTIHKWIVRPTMAMFKSTMLERARKRNGFDD